ncbi:hypothetical protein GQ600_15490 [Phytophthora cactorum]|nr:hypothetical protein GQ600_15490 [Phytophthora cactorum]
MINSCLASSLLSQKTRQASTSSENQSRGCTAAYEAQTCNFMLCRVDNKYLVHDQPREQAYFSIRLELPQTPTASMEAAAIRRRTFVTTFDQPPATSTMVGPLFKQSSESDSTTSTMTKTPLCATHVLARRTGALQRECPSVGVCISRQHIDIEQFLLEESLQTALYYTDNSTTPVYDYSSALPIIFSRSPVPVPPRETVLKLQEEIPLLEMQRDRILFGAKQSIYNVVVEYFHLFRHGLRSLRQVNRRQFAQNTDAQQQLVFLRSSLSSNINIGDCYGVDALVEQWQRYSSYFRDLHFQLEHMEEVVKNVAVVAASLSVTVTETSLQNVVATSLGKTLLGRRLLLPCSLYFEWDEASSHVVRLEMTVDFLTPISRVLGSLTDAAFALSQALITRISGGHGELLLTLRCHTKKHPTASSQLAATLIFQRERYARWWAQAIHKAVLKLREEISQLELQQSHLLSSVKHSVFDVVVEYFLLFRHGLTVWPNEFRSRSSGSAEDQVPPFVDGIGRLPRPTSWCRCSERAVVLVLVVLEELYLQLEHIEKVAANLVVVSASLAVKCVFPHLLENDQDLKPTVGRRLQLPCSLWFEWDEV